MWVEWKILATMLSNEQNGFKATICTLHNLEAMLWKYSINITPIWWFHCLESTKVVHICLLPPSTLKGTTMKVNTFLCHIVAPDETWALVANEGKWQWNKLCNWGSPHPKKFGQNPEGSQWCWLSRMMLTVLPSTMWIQSTNRKFWENHLHPAVQQKQPHSSADTPPLLMHENTCCHVIRLWTGLLT